jgi:hypothetical protein
VRCASAGAERPEGGLRADPAYVVIPQEKNKTKKNTNQTLAHLEQRCCPRGNARTDRVQLW